MAPVTSVSAGRASRQRPVGTRKRSSARPQGAIATLLAKPLSSFYLVLIPVVLLVGIGQLMALSASSVYAQGEGRDPYYYAVRQLIFLAIGVPGAFILSKRSPEFLRKIAWPAWMLAVALLLALFTPLGIETKGNRAWLDLGVATLQPAEFAKLAAVVWAAAVLHNKQRVLDEWKQLLGPMLFGFGVPILLILAGGDLGTAMVLGGIFLGVLWLIGAPLVMFGGIVTVVATVVGLLVVVSENRMTRIQHFLSGVSHDDPNSSQQPLSAVYALATGGWFGVGLGGSRQKWGGLADAAQNDYVLAVIGEEMGLVGTLCVIGLFAVLGFAGVRIAQRADTMFVKVAAGGITVWIMFQACMNIGVALNMIPVIGVPLPFISVGGSALMANLLATGVLLACARHEPEARKVLAADKAQRRRVTRVVQK